MKAPWLNEGVMTVSFGFTSRRNTPSNWSMRPLAGSPKPGSTPASSNPRPERWSTTSRQGESPS